MRRYFTAQDARAAAPPTDRLLYLELLEVDVDGGVARFAYQLAAEDGELWKGTASGWEARADVRDAVKAAVAASLVEGGTFTIPLSHQPQVTQLEVRSADLTSVTVYRLTTQGSDARSFRYRTEADPAERFDASRFTIVLDEDGRPVFSDEGDAAQARIVDEAGRPVIDTAAATDEYQGGIVGDRPYAYN